MLNLDLATVQDVLSAAAHLQLPAVLETCAAYLQVNATSYTFFLISLVSYMIINEICIIYVVITRDSSLTNKMYFFLFIEPTRFGQLR